VLSTHDQVLSGPTGQTYIGCVLPADRGYAADITASAEKIGRRLAREGVIGRFALDFVVVRTARGWKHFALEINVRKGGTTHPCLTLQLLTDGSYVADVGEFFTANRRPRCLVASDHVDLGSGVSLDELFTIAARRGLRPFRQTGVVFHMFGGLSYGFVGLTAIAETRGDAQELFDRVSRILGASPADRDGFMAASTTPKEVMSSLPRGTRSQTRLRA
jgi:hypothetical protein